MDRVEIFCLANGTLEGYCSFGAHASCLSLGGIACDFEAKFSSSFQK